MTAPDLSPANYPAEPEPVDLDALLSDEVPMIYRTAHEKGAAMFADTARYLDICRKQRYAEAAGEPIPSDRDALAQVRAEEVD